MSDPCDRSDLECWFFTGPEDIVQAFFFELEDLAELHAVRRLLASEKMKGREKFKTDNVTLQIDRRARRVTVAERWREPVLELDPMELGVDESLAIVDGFIARNER